MCLCAIDRKKEREREGEINTACVYVRGVSVYERVCEKCINVRDRERARERESV